MLDIFYYDSRLKRGKLEDLSFIKNHRIWIDATHISEEEAELLAKLFKLHEVSKEDIFLSHGRIKVEEFPNYMFCTFYSLQKEGDSVKLMPIEFVLGYNFLITAHKRTVHCYEKIKEREDILEKLFVKGVCFIFHRVLDEEIDNFIPVLEEIDDEIEKLDEELAVKAKPEILNKILLLKKKIVEIKKITLPQREKISFLSRKEYKFLPKSTQPYFRDVYDESIRLEDVVDNHREMIGTTFDTYMTSINNHMSEIMKVLSIIATIALPLTAISGIYGTNFITLPGSKTNYGFWVMIMIMTVIMVGMLLFFKKRKWF
jgi:magnesium transporter